MEKQFKIKAGTFSSLCVRAIGTATFSKIQQDISNLISIE
jgi:hypothetical protein